MTQFRLSLTDFQGWEKVDLDVKGFTAVVGPSSRGKSALIRGLRGVLRNAVGAGRIRLGAKETRVGLDILDHTVELSRNSKDVVTYMVDGSEFGKLGGKVPPVMEDWGFQPVDVNGVTVDPIFAGQFDSQFLLSSSPAETAAILNAFSSTERLDKGRKAIKSDLDDVNKEAKVLATEISGLEAQVAGLNTQAEQAEAFRAELSQLMARARALKLVGDLLGTLNTTVAKQAEVQAKLQVLEKVQPAYADVARATSTSVYATNLLSSQVRQQEIDVATEAMESVEPAVDVAMKAYLRVHRLATVHAGVKAQVKTQESVQALDTLAERLHAALRAYSVLVRVRAVVTSDPDSPRQRAEAIADLRAQTENLAPLYHKAIILANVVPVLTRLADIKTQIASNAHEAKCVQAELIQAEADVDQWRDVNQIVTCPNCNLEFVATQESHEQH